VTGALLRGCRGLAGGLAAGDRRWIGVRAKADRSVPDRSRSGRSGRVDRREDVETRGLGRGVCG
jgi:hypothetical protein